MRLAIASDIHLEFGPIELDNDNNADILILAGDITVATYLDLTQTHLTSGDRKIGQLTRDFFAKVCSKFKDVIYVIGNHEHYKGDFAKTISILRQELKFDNLHILDNEVFEIDDYVFLGGTMWTDCNNNNPLSVFRIKSAMSDFKVIKNSTREAHKWIMEPLVEEGQRVFKDGKEVLTRKSHKYIAKLSPNDTIEEFNKFKIFLNENLIKYKDKKIVVITHHSPTYETIHPLYKGDYHLNGGYSSNLDDLMLNSDNINLWICGHTHHRFDFMVGNVNVLLNPRGYFRYEPQVKTFSLVYKDI